MTKPIAAALTSACVAAALALTGCSSSSTPGNGSTGAASTSGQSAASTSTSAAALAKKMLAAVKNVRSAHLQMAVNAAGTTIAAAGDERLSAGTVSAMKLNLKAASIGSFELIILDGKTYMKVPQKLSHSSKPWLLITANSSNPIASTMANSLSSTLNQTSVDNYRLFVQSAKSVTNEGTDTVSGAPATHYRLIVDPKKLANTKLGASAAKALGTSAVPVDLWVDNAGRPVKVVENLTTMNQHVRATVTMSGYNKPVQISAPPASQVSTK